jgi:hypothetical protein
VSSGTNGARASLHHQRHTHRSTVTSSVTIHSCRRTHSYTACLSRFRDGHGPGLRIGVAVAVAQIHRQIQVHARRWRCEHRCRGTVMSLRDPVAGRVEAHPQHHSAAAARHFAALLHDRWWERTRHRRRCTSAHQLLVVPTAVLGEEDATLTARVLLRNRGGGRRHVG